MNNPPIILPGSSRAIATRTPALRLTMGYFIPPGFLSWLRGYSRLFGAAMIELRLTDIGVVRNKPGTGGVTSLILFRLVRQPGTLFDSETSKLNPAEKYPANSRSGFMRILEAKYPWHNSAPSSVNQYSKLISEISEMDIDIVLHTT